MAPKKVTKTPMKTAKGVVTNKPVKHKPPTAPKKKSLTQKPMAKAVTKNEAPAKKVASNGKIQTAEGWKRAMLKMRKVGDSK